jgi:LDH2 family malate/lactate/ureidoglycolate dehydrogenase
VPGTEGRTLAAAPLAAWSRALLEAAGLPADHAEIVTDTLLDASLRGVDSHGVARLPVYLERLRGGLIDPRGRPRVERESGAVAVVDGENAPGQVVALLATDAAIRLAGAHGVGTVVARRSNHYGAAGYYAVRAARAGLLGFSTTNADPLVVPFGGTRAALGTNPIAFAAPLPDGDVFVLDMATSQVAANKVVNARAEGRAIPAGWAVDAEGRPTTDPNAFAAAVPLGGYKGTGLALMVEVLSAVLAGAAVTHETGRLFDEDRGRPQGLGHWFLALDPERTVGRAAFAGRLAALLDEIRSVPATEEAGEVLVAGDPEARAQAERERMGVPLSAPVVAELEAHSAALGVAVPGP